jgi:nicotinamide-nucleotide amidase
MIKKNSVAILATGDEIQSGSVLNTNAQYAAKRFFDAGIHPGLHITTSDEQAEIEEAMRYLFNEYAAVLIIGGLGPTSDDRTRFALAAVTQAPLLFHEDSWQQVIDRLTRFNLAVPDKNRQQCLFPEQAKIFRNANGTAPGCCLDHNSTLIFMLPGPPREFIPMFDQFVLPKLLQTPLHQSIFQCSWLLLGVSEGGIAEKLDPQVNAPDVSIHYRVDSPYVEVKLQSAHLTVLNRTKMTLLPWLEPYLVSEKNQAASTQLLFYLDENQQTFSIHDHATYGRLQSVLLTPETFSKVYFKQEIETDIVIELQGLQEYWSADKQATETSVTLHFKKPQQNTVKKSILLRGALTLHHATEIICWEILKFLRECHPK